MSWRAAVIGVLACAVVHGQQLGAGVELVERIGGLARPWGAAALPDGRLIVSEFEGTLRLFGPDDRLLAALPAPDDLDQRRIVRGDNTGAFDVVVDPGFLENGTVYWAYAARVEDESFLKVVALRLQDNDFGEPRDLWAVTPSGGDRYHYGGALAFDRDGGLLVATGERHSSAAGQGGRFPSQQSEDGRGKLWRLTQLDERTPAAEIVAAGLRNVQSIAGDASTDIWFVDHGPIGGDELNRLVVGANYGWPLETSGRYKPPGPGSLPSRPDLVPPAHTWSEPTLAPSGLLWHANGWLVTGLSSGRLVHLRQSDRGWVQEEWIVGLRLRDVIRDGAGRLLVLTDERDGRVLEVRHR